MAYKTESVAEYNKLNDLTEEQRSTLASLIDERWRWSTEEIREILDESKRVWQFLLNNRYGPVINKDNGFGDVRAAEGTMMMGEIPRATFSIHAQQHQATFPQDEKFFKSTPVNPMGKRYSGKYDDFKTQNLMESDFLLANWLHRLNAFVDGTSVSAVHWEQKKRKRVKYSYPVEQTDDAAKLLNDMKGAKKKVTEEIAWEGSRLIPLSLHEWRVDPTARCFEDSWIIWRYYQPVYEVERVFDIDDVQPYNDTEFDNEWQERRTALGQTGLSNDGRKHADAKGMDCMIDVCYDDFVIDGEVYENHVAYVLNKSQLIFFGPNWYDHGMKPFVLQPYIPIPSSIYGQSGLKHAINPAATIDTAMEKMLSVADWGSNPVILELMTGQPSYLDQQGGDFRQEQSAGIVVRPGDTIPVTRADQYQQLRIDLTNLQYMLQVVEQCRNTIREVTGANSVIAGEDPGKLGQQITAFQVDQHIQGTNIRFRNVMEVYNNSTLEPFLYMAFENDKQFKDREEAVPGYEEPLTPDDIKVIDLDFTITSVQAMATRGRELANLREFITNMLPGLVQNGVVKLKQEMGEVDMLDLLNQFLVKGGMPNADSVIKKVKSADEATPQADTNQPPMPPQGAMPQMMPGGMPNGFAA